MFLFSFILKDVAYILLLYLWKYLQFWFMDYQKLLLTSRSFEHFLAENQ